MPTVAQLITASAPSVIRIYDKPYILSPVMQPANFHGYKTNLYDPQTGHSVSIAWSLRDELTADTEGRKIALVKALLENAVYALTDFIEGRQGEYMEEVQDVTYE